MSTVGLLTEDEGDGSTLPATQHHEGMRQPLHERGVLETVVAVMGVAVNWRCAHALHVFCGSSDGQDVHLPVVRKRRGHGRDASNGHQLGVVGVRRTSLDLLETEQLPETVGHSYGGVAHVAWAATSLGGRNDLNTVQAIVPADGRSGGVVEELSGGADLIRRGDYGNAEGHRIHAGWLRFL